MDKFVMVDSFTFPKENFKPAINCLDNNEVEYVLAECHTKEEIIEEMTKTLKRHHFAKEKESIQMTEKLLEYIKDQKDICQTLLLSNNGKNIEKRIMDIAKDFLISNTIPTKPVEATYLSTFIVSGAIHVIKDWLTHDTLETPKQIAEMINYFSHYGLGYLKK